MSDGDRRPGHVPEIAHASLSGAIAAAAMTGLRACTVDLGLVEQRPVERAALGAGHLRYGLVLSEMGARPQEAAR